MARSGGGEGSEIVRIEAGERMSQIVIHNGIVYLAGQVGRRGTDAGTQTRAALEEVDRLLALAGTSKARILSAQVWLADMADFEAMNAVWDAWVDRSAPPARAAGQIPLARPKYRVEVVVTAAL